MPEFWNAFSCKLAKWADFEKFYTNLTEKMSVSSMVLVILNQNWRFFNYFLIFWQCMRRRCARVSLRWCKYAKRRRLARRRTASSRQTANDDDGRQGSVQTHAHRTHSFTISVPFKQPTSPPLGPSCKGLIPDSLRNVESAPAILSPGPGGPGRLWWGVGSWRRGLRPAGMSQSTKSIIFGTWEGERK